jgi:phage FluMu protein Com
MIIPIRCFTCGKVLGQVYERYLSLLDQQKTEAEALEELEKAEADDTSFTLESNENSSRKDQAKERKINQKFLAVSSEK